MAKADDLAGLLPPPGTEEHDLGFRQGVIRTWDLGTGANTVDVGGATVSNLPVLSESGLVVLYPGDIVGILRVRSQYFILGRITTVDQQRMQYLTVQAIGPTTADSTIIPGTTSTSFVDLWTGQVVRATKTLYFFSATVVPASTSAQFRFTIGGTVVDTSSTYTTGNGFYYANVPFPDAASYNAGTTIALQAKVVSGTGRVAASMQGVVVY